MRIRICRCEQLHFSMGSNSFQTHDVFFATELLGTELIRMVTVVTQLFGSGFLSVLKRREQRTKLLCLSSHTFGFQVSIHVYSVITVEVIVELPSLNFSLRKENRRVVVLKIQ